MTAMLKKRLPVGIENFEKIRRDGFYYVDKTDLIKELLENWGEVNLFTRPRRFGKTLNMSMLECFFSNKYAGRGDLFEGLSIWNDEKYRQLQGTYPVIFLSFAGIKSDNINDAKLQIKGLIATVYGLHRYMLEGNFLSANEKAMFERMTMFMEDALCYSAINMLCSFLERYYGKKAIVLLDEYDTPMQEAYIHGYWDEFTSFIRNIFNNTFKTNPYLERAIMTGITRVSKQSIFSDLNNINVVTTTSDEYGTDFGFTEDEVYDSLDKFGLSDRKDDVKKWYDGFIFGSHRDIYNPWSITSYLDKKKLAPYWVWKRRALT